MSETNLLVTPEGWITQIQINASRELVWQKLTDFAAYHTWNPFVLEAQATFSVDEQIYFLEDLQDFGQHWITAKFLLIQEPEEFIWQGHVYAPCLFQVNHGFKLLSLEPDQTLFIHSHNHRGLLLPFLAMYGVFKRSQQGYLAFNQALKTLCEAS